MKQFSILSALLLTFAATAQAQILTESFSEGTPTIPVTLNGQAATTSETPESWISNTGITTDGSEALLPYTTPADTVAYTGYIGIPTPALSSSDLIVGKTYTLSFNMSTTGGDQWTAVGFGTQVSTTDVPYQGGNDAGFWALDNGAGINIFDEVGGTLHDLGAIGGASGAVTLTILVGATTDTLSATVNSNPVTLSTTSAKLDPIADLFVGDFSASGTVSDLSLAETPEPSTYAMMLGALAVLGLCVRRSRLLRG